MCFFKRDGGKRWMTLALTQLTLSRTAELQEAPLRKTKQGRGFRKEAGEMIPSVVTPLFALRLCRWARPRRAATSRWCSATCGGVKAFQGECRFLPFHQMFKKIMNL